MTTQINRRWMLAERPVGAITDQTFDLREEPVPVPGVGQALVRVAWLGIDATQRGWLNDDATYTTPVEIGGVMRGSGVGEVIASNSDTLAVGDWVYGTVGWQDYVLAGEEGLFGLNPVPPGIDPKMMLGIYGVNGLTAYFGMTDIGRPAVGDTVLVTGAAGGVGSIAGQIAKALGCRVIGTAGRADKVEWVTNVAGFDACINYRTEDTETRLRELAPDGINVVFDNVGGEMLEAALANIASHARIVVCGGISSGYTSGTYGVTPRNYMELGFKRARMEGFIFLDYVSRFLEALGRLVGWVAEGKIVHAEQIEKGLKRGPTALQGLFEGRNLGKQLVRLSMQTRLEHLGDPALARWIPLLDDVMPLRAGESRLRPQRCRRLPRPRCMEVPSAQDRA